MLNLKEKVLYNEFECAFLNSKKNIILICETGTDGIVYTVYDMNNHFSMIDGGIIEFPNITKFEGYTIRELFEFVQDLSLNISFDESCRKLKNSATERLIEYIDELVDLNFNTSVYIHQNTI